MSTKTNQKLFYSFFFALITALFFWLVGNILEHPLPSTEKPVQLYANQTGDDFRQVIITAIDSAKESVNLTIYTLTDRAVIQALRKKASEGVPVHVLCDGDACGTIVRKLGPEVTLSRSYGKGLMHRKILIVDRQLVVIGSANLTGESLRLHGNLITLFDSEPLGSYLLDKLDHSTPAPTGAEFVIGGQKVEVWMLPEDLFAVERIVELIRSAKKTIRVAMFTWTRMDFVQELIAAVKRGVQVQVAIDRNSGQGVSKKVARTMQKNRVSVRLSNGAGLLHHKFLIIDDDILVNGSANWTKAAFKVNDDCFVAIHDLNKDQRKKIQSIWSIVWSETQGLKL